VPPCDWPDRIELVACTMLYLYQTQTLVNLVVQYIKVPDAPWRVCASHPKLLWFIV
jgi:hypothetical protein